MDGTAVMTLGRLGQAQPQLRYNPMPGHRTATPQQFQNLPRPSLQNGPHAFGSIFEVTSLGNLGKVRRFLGDAAVPGQAEAVEELQQAAEGMQSNEDPYIPNASAAGRVPLWAVAGLYAAPVSAAVSAYHGYRRHNSLGGAIGWAVMGGLFPLITPAVGLAQGWGKRAR